MSALGRALGLGRVGIGWRPELAGDLLADPGLVDFVEVVAETCFTNEKRRREAEALTALWPVVPHGVKLSLASAESVDPARVERLASLVRTLRAPLVTEHVAFVRAGGQEIGHLTAPPRTRAAVTAVARNVATLRSALPLHVPVLLENAATTVRWPDDEMSPGAFAAELAKATGCGLLLDISNLCADAWNAGLSPSEVLADYPWENVGMVHVAGGHWTDVPARFYVDSHADPISPAVFAALRELLAKSGALPLLLERDDAFPPFAELAKELETLKSLSEEPATQAAPTKAPAHPRREKPVGELALAALAHSQEKLASLLTAPHAPSAENVHPFSALEVDLTRGILVGKRLDDALPLLPHLARRSAEVKALPQLSLAGIPRPLLFGPVADALHLARMAETLPTASHELRRDARRDLAILRASFALNDDGALPRWSPHATPFEDGRGRTAWAIKGPGRHARVRIWSPPW